MWHDVADPSLELIHPGIRVLSTLSAAQQPRWREHPDLSCIRGELAALPSLVDHHDIWALRDYLARVEDGEALLLHVGECAELFSMAAPWHVASRLDLYRSLAGRLTDRTGRPVVLIARMAGQHAKPRSEETEKLPTGGELPVYRGDAVNAIEATVAARRVDPWRMLTSYDRSRDTLDVLTARHHPDLPVFVSHEALLKDYEEPMTRGGDVLYSASGHLLWVGERTRGHEDWHVRWASAIANPVGVKVGPGVTGSELTRLARVMNPRREEGRLSLIARLGAATAARVGPLARAVAESGTPVLWQCDPMHGNTFKLDGRKVRLLTDIRAEVAAFVRSAREYGCVPGGLHLEVTPGHSVECHEHVTGLARPSSRPPCDPRLNPAQAANIIDCFADEITGGPR